MDKIATLSFAEIKADPALQEVALTGGRIAFADNCQPCHGAGGAGRPGYPALAAGAWIWGGSPRISSRPLPTASAAAIPTPAKAPCPVSAPTAS